MTSKNARVALLALAVLASGCHRAVRADRAKEAPALCTVLDAANAAAIARASTAVAAAPEVALLTARLRAATACTATRDGGWGIRLADVTTADGGVWARWSLVHGSADSVGVSPETASGALGAGGPEPAASGRNLLWTATRRIVPDAPVLHDLDGEGEPEAIVVVEAAEVSESGRSTTVRRGRIWRGQGATVELFPPTRELTVEAFRDVDRDGRPDIVTRGPYVGSATVACGSEETYPVLGPPLLAHAMGGGRFDLADDVAITFASASCPAESGEAIVVKGHEGDEIDQVRAARNVACARLRGTDARPLLAEIAAACTPPPGAGCPPCDNPALLQSWASLPPPARLSR